MTRRSPRPRVLGLVAVALAATALGACGSSASSDVAGAPGTTIPAAGCLPAGESAADTAGPYAVGRQTVTFVDPSRPTDARPNRNLPAEADRTLPTVILYPSPSADGTEPAGTVAPVDGAPAAAGRFPLIVASHGVLSNGSEMAAKAETWVRAGYIVAAPTFPLSSNGSADITDLPNQPGDVRFVVDSTGGLDTDPSSPLAGHVAPDCLALAGHSLGAATTLEATYESNLLVPGVNAAIEMSGVLVPMPGGSFDDPPPVPLLLLHGDKDPVVPIAGSIDAYAKLPGDHWFVTFHGGDHNSIFQPPYDDDLNQAAIAFLDAQLKGAPGPTGPINQLAAESNGRITLQTTD